MGKVKYTDGYTVGNKQIVRVADKTKTQTRYIWRCLKCKKEYGPSVGTDIFKSKYSKCCQRRFDEKTNYRGHRLLTGSKVTQIKDGAHRRGIEFNVTAEYLWSVWEKQGGLCAYTGLPIALNTPKSASLDRKDSSIGYIEGNVHWVLWEVNRMKLNMPEQRFFELCSLIANRTKGKTNE